MFSLLEYKHPEITTHNTDIFTCNSEESNYSIPDILNFWYFCDLCIKKY